MLLTHERATLSKYESWETKIIWFNLMLNSLWETERKMRQERRTRQALFSHNKTRQMLFNSTCLVFLVTLFFMLFTVMKPYQQAQVQTLLKLILKFSNALLHYDPEQELQMLK